MRASLLAGLAGTFTLAPGLHAQQPLPLAEPAACLPGPQAVCMATSEDDVRKADQIAGKFAGERAVACAMQGVAQYVKGMLLDEEHDSPEQRATDAELRRFEDWEKRVGGVAGGMVVD